MTYWITGYFFTIGVMLMVEDDLDRTLNRWTKIGSLSLIWPMYLGAITFVRLKTGKWGTGLDG